MNRLLISLLLIGISIAAFASDDLAQRATEAMQAGDTEAAVELYNELLSQNPEDGAAHYWLGTAYMTLDQLDNAIEHFEKAGELGFQPLGVGYRLARIYARQGRTEEAITKLDETAQGGFGFISLIEGEADFESLRGNEGFEAAVTKIRNNRFPCEGDPRHHAFDFWIGEWDVYQAGALAGENTIEPILGHCTLLENWTSAQGGEGKSFNFYDPGYDHWRQLWISDNGSFIEFHGQFVEGEIRYEATTRAPGNGAETLHKLTFTRNDDGSVRQHWEQSTDGTTWSTVWDAQYIRKAESAD